MLVTKYFYKTQIKTLFFLKLIECKNVLSLQNVVLIILVNDLLNTWDRIQHQSRQCDHHSHQDEAGVVAPVVVKKNS